jgi:hypothetical protein
MEENVVKNCTKMQKLGEPPVSITSLRNRYLEEKPPEYKQECYQLNCENRFKCFHKVCLFRNWKHYYNLNYVKFVIDYLYGLFKQVKYPAVSYTSNTHATDGPFLRHYIRCLLLTVIRRIYFFSHIL